ncbi:MAG TPA: helix-turn-helix domain-containing protein [Acetobacteraceae bacterium]|jgi:AraC-like DNA-binding protein|nr:helix-turn-helix domain-containing protein [Acetobacteraceae bacterium]
MHSHHRDRGGSSRSFTDPDEYQSAIRGGDARYSVLGLGAFEAELTTIEFGRLTLQRGREHLPRLASSAMPPNKVGMLGWFGDRRLPVVRGLQMRRGDWMYLGPGMQSNHRTFGRNDFVALTLDAGDLTRAAIALTGCALTATPGMVLRPPDRLGDRLLSTIGTATDMTRTASGIFASRHACDALEEALLRPMVMCLLHGETRRESKPRGRRAAMAKTFEAVVEANFNRPLLVSDLCRIVGVSERTLRNICQEQMGMSPHQFLALRRLHLARRAPLRSDQQTATVTGIAMSHGVWELGRFAVAYKSLFGESPSATLRRSFDM